MSSTYDDDTAIVEGLAYLGYAIAIFITVFVIYNTSWSDVEKREANNKQQGWQQVLGTVDGIESRAGTLRPETERVDVTYTYDKSDLPVRTSLNLNLGYKPGDKVVFFANKDSQTKVIESRFIGVQGYDPTVYSTYNEYLMAIFYAVVFWIVAGFIMWFVLLIMAVCIGNIWDKVKTKPQLTQSVS